MYHIPYSKTEIAFDLPAGMSGTVAVSKSLPPIEDVPAAIEAALLKPINSPPVRELAKPGDKVCLVFTDITRASPDFLLVPPLLTELDAAGVHDEDITLLCGIGMHRPSTPEEKVAKLGQAVVDRYRVVDNQPQNPDALVDLGTTASGIPLAVNKIAYEADLLIATGIVEPHQYAGYSGGRKTLSVGAAGEAMIAYTHGPQMVDHPGTRLGKIEGNPFHEAVTEAARRAASYLFFAPTPVVKPGGVFIIPARCEEGAGDGVGEQRFLHTMKSATGMSSLLAELRRTGYPPGAQRAFVMAKVLEQTDVIIVGSETPEIVRDAKMLPAADMDKAFRLAADRLGPKLDVLIVPHALLTLPIVDPV